MRNVRFKPALILHGGTGGSGKNPKRLAQLRQSMANILEKAHSKLIEEGSLEAVVWAVSLLENDPLFNAGTGAQIQADGHSRLSASVMDGSEGHFAGVINVENIANPVLVARLLLREKHRVLEGEGAFQYALGRGFHATDTRTTESVRRWQKQKALSGMDASDTVGACAVDAQGRVVSATSTGGLGMEIPGRVSDSAMPAGNYANQSVAVSATGIDEDIIDECLSAKIVFRVSDGMTLAQAFEKSFEEAGKAGRHLGAIGIDREGNLCWQSTAPLLVYAWKRGRETKIF